MPHLLTIAVDLVAVAALTDGVYYRRYRRRDMLLAYCWPTSASTSASSRSP